MLSFKGYFLSGDLEVVQGQFENCYFHQAPSCRTLIYLRTGKWQEDSRVVVWSTLPRNNQLIEQLDNGG